MTVLLVRSTPYGARNALQVCMLVKMPMCQAYGCSNKPGKLEKKSFFQIPNPDIERERCAKWLNNIGTDKFNVKTYKFCRSRVVCEDHFDPQCFEEDIRSKVMGYESKRKILKPNTVPTIFVQRRQPLGERPSTEKRKKRKEREKSVLHHGAPSTTTSIADLPTTSKDDPRDADVSDILDCPLSSGPEQDLTSEPIDIPEPCQFVTATTRLDEKRNPYVLDENPRSGKRRRKDHFDGAQRELQRTDNIHKLTPFAVPTLFSPEADINKLVLDQVQDMAQVPDPEQGYPQRVLDPAVHRPRLTARENTEQDHSYCIVKERTATNLSPDPQHQSDEEDTYLDDEDPLPMIEEDGDPVTMMNEVDTYLDVEDIVAMNEEDTYTEVEETVANVLMRMKRQCDTRREEQTRANEDILIDPFPREPIIVVGNSKCRCAALQRKVAALQEKLRREQREKRKLLGRNFQVNIAKLFNKEQLAKLGSKSMKGSKWSDETMKKAFEMRLACGAPGYEFLLAQNMPLPSMKTLKRELAKQRHLDGSQDLPSGKVQEENRAAWQIIVKGEVDQDATGLTYS